MIHPAEEAEAAALVSADHRDPFAFLGPHGTSGGVVVRAFRPGADAIEIVDPSGDRPPEPLARIHPGGVFAACLSHRAPPRPYRLRIKSGSTVEELHDAYAFGPILGDLDLHLLAEGTHRRPFERLGAHPIQHDKVEGTGFVVWAPNAARVSVVGSFNDWDGRRHPMRLRHDAGLWELFVPDVAEGALYKFEIKTRSGEILLKSDPFAFRSECPPRTASVVHDLTRYAWGDDVWMRSRAATSSRTAPISIYEVHLGSWRRRADGSWMSYGEIADALISYVNEMEFTHIELLPVSEHPFDGSWGYQPTGLYAPTSRFGAPDDLRAFVNRCHQAGIGVILDWVPGHFPTDACGLGRFDGTALYEHADDRQGVHKRWGTAVYNFGRNEVQNFLIANALFWLEQYHLDGLRVDAVAAMLYLDYDRDEVGWLPNRHGGRENLEAVSFLRRFNTAVYGNAAPGAVTIAEESTAWPMVSRPVDVGGLGFGYKWNMGWMNDTLLYMGKDPIHRRYHHALLTFGLLYAFSENFVLALSHDEVVHGKRSLLGKMPGDRWQQFANLRLLLAFQYTLPGKKLLFMGCEFGQAEEWNHDRELSWDQIADPMHAGVRRLVQDMNHLYRSRRTLQNDCEPDGFRWIDCHDIDQSVIAYLRLGAGPPIVGVCNFTPVVHSGYRLGVPAAGRFREVLNTDALDYAGSGVGNLGAVESEAIASHGYPHSLVLTLPPLGCVVFEAPGAP